MPTLDWIGKEKVITYDQEVPFHVLDRQYSFDKDGTHAEDNSSENMIIHGDNLTALKSLLPKYEGRIDCIYIDPPYNTGNENWIYNDNVNDPRIQKWIGEVVGGEGEDLSRHDKWLCMMYPRLRLLEKLLADGGTIFISINDIEVASLKLICDNIFRTNSFVTDIHWKRSESQNNNAKLLSIVGEHILCYVKNKTKESTFNKVSLTQKAKKEYHYKDDHGYFRRGTIVDNTRGTNILTVTSPDGKTKQIKSIRTDEYIEDLKNRDMIYWTKNGTPYSKIYLEESEGQTLSNWFDDVGVNEDATETLTDMGLNFPFSKPYTLIKKLINMTTNENSIILDSFAGSGTTAQAVLDLNKEDDGNRKFILIEMENYADSITAERVKNVIKGYKKSTKCILYDKKITAGNLEYGAEFIEEAKNISQEARDSGIYRKVSKPKITDGKLQVIATTKANTPVEGTGGSFSFYELGEPLMKDGNLNEDIKIEQICEYIYYSETKSAPDVVNLEEPYFLGKYMQTAYYFYYEKGQITTLNRDFLHVIKTRAEIYVIYADRCLLNDEELEKYHITFKKIPRDIAKL